jgi:hypothetical protein
MKVKKRKVASTQSAGAKVKPATMDITVQDPEVLALRRLIENRRRITRKISRLPALEARLKIENPGVTLSQMFERLQKRKGVIDKALAKHDGLSRRAKEKRGPAGVRQSSVIMERAPMSLEEILARQQNRVMLDWRDVLKKDCPAVNGRAMPYLARTGSTVAAINDLNHNSSANYIVDQQSYFGGELCYLISAWLDDDASIWRDDDPDSMMWYDNICLYLPNVQCDSRIVASLSVRFSGEIASEADDHNEVSQYVYVAHSDENGNLPPYVTFGDEYQLNTLDLSGEIGLPFGNRFDSEWVTATMSFNAKANTMPMVEVANCTELKAQDGTLRIIGSWEITDLIYSITPL